MTDSLDQSPTPRLTIGLPVRNGESDLPKSIGSLLNQSFTDFELVVCDNDSTDGTPELLQKFAAEDSRVSVHQNETNIGHLGNFDKALRLARGEFFMWASADDFWRPEFASALTNQLDADPTAQAAASAVRRVTPSGEDHDTVRFSLLSGQKPISRLALARVISAGYTNRLRYHLLFYSIFRREFLQSGMPYPSVTTVYPDRTFMTQLALGGQFTYVDRPLMSKSLSDTPVQTRWAGEAFGRAHTEDSWRFLKASWAVVPCVLQSEAVPRRQKLLVPVVLAAALWGYRHVLYTGKSPLRLPVTIPYRFARRFGAILLRRKSNPPPPSA